MTTSRYRIVLKTDADRAEAIRRIRDIKPGSSVTLIGPTRSIPQNDRMWAMLTDISEQLVWCNQLYPPEIWKDFFMHTLRGDLWMPGEKTGKGRRPRVPIGHSTSALTKDEMSDLMEVIAAFGSRHGVRFYNEPPMARAR